MVQTDFGYDYCKGISDYLTTKTSVKPKIAIICGSGLSGLAGSISSAEIFKYEDIPNFPRSTVEGHAGELVFGKIGDVEVVAMKGRFHPYEGYPLQQVVAPVRIFKLLGVQTLIVSNAAGGLNRDYKVCDVMLMKDHINLLGFANQSPMNGPNDPRFGDRFFSMTYAYTPSLLKLAREIWAEQGNDFIREGVYASVGGPSYESIAECKMLSICGADAVGMSTTQEVTAAAHCGLNVLGMSLITNYCIMDYDSVSDVNHEEVLESAALRSKDICKFVTEFVKRCPLN